MTTNNIYIPHQGALSDIAGWIAGDLGPAVARLYSVNVPYLPTRVCGNYTEAAFPGYAPASPLAWGVPFINGGGKAESDSAVLTWTDTALAGTYQVFGIYVTNVPLTKLLMVIPFLGPFVFSPSNNVLSYMLQATEVSEL
jgi:hypothetical protein